MEQKKRVLVIDDDSGIGEMLKTLLEFYGFDVDVTEKPDEAESIISEKDTDMVILDMLISGVNGTDVCRRLRKNENTAEIPILMMSALHDAGKKCKEAGADDFIAKPFEMEELIKTINGVLNSKQSI